MPRIRRATATATAEQTDDDAMVAVALNNNDGQERRVYGALLSVFAGNDTISDQSGAQAVLSSQSFTTEALQQGFDFRGTSVVGRASEEARAGPFAVVQTSGRDDNESSNEIFVDFGHPENWLPWPDGSQMHLLMASRAPDDNGARAHAILYYQEGAGGL